MACGVESSVTPDYVLQGYKGYHNMLLQLIDKASSLNYTHMIITGDFNVKEIDWVNHFTNTNPNHLAYNFFLLNQW